MYKPIWGWAGATCALALFALTGPTPAQAFTLNGFGDITYQVAEDTTTGEDSNGFALGQLDFYVSEQISDRVNVLAELVIEGSDGGFVVDLERLQVGYAVANNHRIRAGRFHNLLGYWNLAFHHGAQLHTSIARPFFIEFEDENGVIPTHMVGLWWNSRFQTGMGRLNVGVMVSNGTSLSGQITGPSAEALELDPNNVGDSDRDKAIATKVALEPSFMRGMEIGLFAYSGKVNITDEFAGTITQVDQIIWGADIVYLANNLEVLSEVYQWVNDTEGDTKRDGNLAYYLQVGYLVADKFTPYARIEYLSVQNDAYFRAVGMTNGTDDRQKLVSTFGVRYDINYRAALKAELRSTDDEQDGAFNEGAVQWTFAF